MLIKKLKLFAALLFLCLIIAMPGQSYEYTLKALKLWALTVMPGIFPASFMGLYITDNIKTDGRAFVGFVIIEGLLTGFPTAAILINNLYKKDRESIELYVKLLPLCNIASPVFLCNYVHRHLAGDISVKAMLICMYLPLFIMIITVLLREKHRFYLQKSNTINKTISDKKSTSYAELMAMNMLKSGVYIVMFGVITGFIGDMSYINSYVRYAVCGILEMTNGIAMFSRHINNLYIRNLLILMTTAFGGVSTIMQTIAVSDMKLSLINYICPKAVYAVLVGCIYSLGAYFITGYC